MHQSIDPSDDVSIEDQLWFMRMIVMYLLKHHRPDGLFVKVEDCLGDIEDLEYDSRIRDGYMTLRVKPKKVDS